MKKVNKFSAAVLTATLLAVPFVHPVYAAPGNAVKAAQTESVKGNVDQSTKGKSAAWDKSTLTFPGQNPISDEVSAIVQNHGSQAMQGEAVYEVYWSAEGNPKNGQVVATGVIHALQPGETQVLTYTPDQLVPGNYIFKAYQRPGHPGTGELWSESITVKEGSQTPEQPAFQAPLDQFFNSSVVGGTATFTVPEGVGKVEISFSSYVYPEGTVDFQEDGKPYENQTVYDNVTKVYGPGTYTVHVDLPEHQHWQSDLYLGPVIETLTTSGHPLDKIIDADFGSTN